MPPRKVLPREGASGDGQGETLRRHVWVSWGSRACWELDPGQPSQEKTPHSPALESETQGRGPGLRSFLFAEDSATLTPALLDSSVLPVFSQSPLVFLDSEYHLLFPWRIVYKVTHLCLASIFSP